MTNQNNKQQQQPLTFEDIKGMSKEEIVERIEEVRLVLENRFNGEGGGQCDD